MSGRPCPIAFILLSFPVMGETVSCFTAWVAKLCGIHLWGVC